MKKKRPKKILYEEWIYEWLQEKKLYVKESTYANYTTTIFNYILPYLGNYNIQDLNHTIIQEYLLKLYQKGNNLKGLSDKTVKDTAIIVKSSLRKAFNQGIVPTFELKFMFPSNTRTYKIKTLTKSEQVKITEYAIANPSPKNIALLLSLYSGLRIGEICALKWEDIDLKKGIIKIDKTIQRIYLHEKERALSKVIISSPKTENAIREIPINKILLALLKEQKRSISCYIVTGHEKYAEPRSFRKYFDSLLKKLRIEHVNYHVLRHTFATNCIALGVDYKTVSEILGHSNVTITLNLYVHPRFSEKKRCIDLVSKAFFKPIDT